jgi:hypothetical protein
LIEKPQSSDRFVKSQNPHGQSQRTTPASASAAAAASSLSALCESTDPSIAALQRMAALTGCIAASTPTGQGPVWAVRVGQYASKQSTSCKLSS